VLSFSRLDVAIQQAEEKMTSFGALLKWKAKMDRKGVEEPGAIRHVNVVTLGGTRLEDEYKLLNFQKEIGMNEGYHSEGSGRLIKFSHVGCSSIMSREADVARGERRR
jgi:hypothetical protein